MKRAKDLIVFKVKASRCLKILDIGIEGRILGCLLWTPLRLDKLLAMSILRRGDARAAAGSTVVRMGMRRKVVLEVMRRVVEVGHGV